MQVLTCIIADHGKGATDFFKENGRFLYACTHLLQGLTFGSKLCSNENYLGERDTRVESCAEDGEDGIFEISNFSAVKSLRGRLPSLRGDGIDRT